ncbi:hypothetical protein NM208_g5342 [Fusarium decemcellulare]|uniref:Uncharacterized protein n=1 Tax=Fusarium decemcellulare TaxID=57161 RepID=A0ACC1SHF6_9HYPO|nr:hypothetical protein NM208_g5342 [Fusarium decemcellulare]
MPLPKGSSLYASLRISGSQIRLLTILSTTPEISCRLEVAESGNKVPFNALSYVWGDPTVTEAILVNGHKIQVTTNLVSALRYAPQHLSESKHATSKKLWVDAICINQKDITEKNHQVSLMKDIYSQSGVVLCWLGLPSQPIHAAMDAIEVVAHERHIRDADGVCYKHHDELLDCFEQLRSHLQKLDVKVAKRYLALVEETSVASGIVGDVEIYAVTNALQHTSKVIFGVLQESHGGELRLCQSTVRSVHHEVTNWHDRFRKRANKLDASLLEYSHPIGFLVALLSYRLRKFSRMCHEFIYQMYCDETYNNLIWLKQYPWLYEVKEVVGESLTGPAQPLFDVPYWSRIWIRQEIILAHHPVFVCGSRSLSLETLESFAAWVRWILDPFHSELSKKAELSKLVMAYQPTWKLLHYIFESRRTVGFPTRCFLRLEDLKINIWWASPDARATDPKDYYYGLIGITNLDLTPDYDPNKSVGVVCQEFMVAYLGSRSTRDQRNHPAGGLLNLLMFAGVGYGWNSDPDMPSWGPNFPGQAQAKPSSRGDSDAISVRDPRGLDCIFKSRSDAIITGSSMDVSVLILDRIEAIGPRVSDYGRPELLHKTGLPITWSLDFALRHKSYVSRGHPLTALRSMLEPLSVSYNNPDGFPIKDCLGFAKFLARFGRPVMDGKSRVVLARLLYLKDLFDQVPDPADPEDEASYFANLAAVTKPYNHAIAETKKGYVGRFPPKIQEGDSICLLSGLDQTAVLRQMGDHYEFDPITFEMEKMSAPRGTIADKAADETKPPQIAKAPKYDTAILPCAALYPVIASAKGLGLSTKLGARLAAFKPKDAGSWTGFFIDVPFAKDQASNEARGFGVCHKCETHGASCRSVFTADAQRLNVLLTRQECGLVVVGDIYVAKAIEKGKGKGKGKGKSRGPKSVEMVELPSGEMAYVRLNCTKANTLYELMKSQGMKLVTPPGTITYTRGEVIDNTASCIDLVFISDELRPRFQTCGLRTIPSWKLSDHRAIQMTLDVKLYRDDSKTSLKRGNLTTIEQLDRRAEEILEAIKRVINACVPTRLRYPAPNPHRNNAALRSAVQGRAQPKASANRRKQKHWGRYWTRRIEQYIYGKRRAKKLRWRHRVASQTQNDRGLYQMARLAKRMCQPKDKTRIPPLKSGGVTHTTEEEKGNCLRDTMWPETSDGDTAPPLPMPDFRPHDKFSADQSLTEEEVDRLIKSLPTGKAAGYDGIANEALKMARVELVPILTEFFAACLTLSHHPKSFKHAITVIIPKDGKDTYSDPKSWRPIALLPSLGKLLEKIVTNRLKKLAMDHNLLPASQYGAPGKSTSSAIHAILKRVYKAWSRRTKKQWKKAVTVMSLDISGAFNRVKREILLKILVKKKVPTWLVKFVWSFLSDCTTVLKMPGSTTESFFVNIGIPQGSPLSPILFLFFSAPILQSVAESKIASVSAFAYVDDTYLVVVSRNYRDNCTALEQVHETILKWSGPAGVTFSPPKYKIMHFKHPAETEADSSKLPNIPGLQNIETCLKTKLNILGVIVDHRLTWDEHIKEIERKVAKQLRYLRRISNSVYGLSLKAARQIYVTKIRPTIAYACQAWFIYTWSKTGGWRLSDKNLQRLDKLQYTCLHAVSTSSPSASSSTAP